MILFFLNFIKTVELLKNYILLYKNNTKNNPNDIYEQDIKLSYYSNNYKNDFKISKKIKLGVFAKLSKKMKEKLERDNHFFLEEDQEIQLNLYKNSFYSKIDHFNNKFINEYIEDYYIKNDYQENIPEAFKLQRNAPWGISMVSGHQNNFEYLKSTGKNVLIYVLDSGIDINHSEFEGRAEWGENFIDSVNKDQNGHGTHVSGTIIGKNYGIAKKAKAIAVKVIDKKGSGRISTILLGLDFVIKDFERRKTRKYEENLYDKKEPLKAIVNLSIGGSKSEAINFFIHYAIKYLGIHFSVAAGNENKNACHFSPSSSKSSITVGAVDKNNEIAYFSNVGRCVEIYAPGIEILSSWPTEINKRKAAVLNGTSMAAPHVTGIMAFYLTFTDFKPSELKKLILKDAVEYKEHRIASLKKVYERIKLIN